MNMDLAIYSYELAKFSGFNYQTQEESNERMAQKAFLELFS